MVSLSEGIEFANNPDPRCACVLLLDTSGSMSGDPIDLLNNGLLTFQQDIKQDALAQRRSEIAIVTFGNGGVNVVQDFVVAGQLQIPRLDAGGVTPMGQAIELGLDMVEQRKQQYKQFGVAYYRPWIFLITDGEPTDSWQRAAQRVHNEARDNKVVFFAVGVPPNANKQILSQISPTDRPPVMLQGLQFSQMFVWLSQSQKRVSASKVGEKVALPPIGWAEV